MVDNERVEQVFNHALGLAVALSQERDAVDELVTLSRGDPAVIRRALARVNEQIERVQSRPAGTGIGPPEAPATLASRLLAEAMRRVSEHE